MQSERSNIYRLPFPLILTFIHLLSTRLLGGEMVYVHGIGARQQSAGSRQEERRKAQASRGENKSFSSTAVSYGALTKRADVLWLEPLDRNGKGALMDKRT